MILSKVFQGNNSEWFVFVDVASVEQKRDPTHDETLQIQAAEEKTKKRKLKSSVSGKQSRKKLAVDPNQSALVDELSGKDIESGEGNVISMGENQKTSDDGLVYVKANETREEAVESEQDLKKGEKIAAATTDVVMIDRVENLENVLSGADNLLPTCDGGEKVTNTLVKGNEKVDNGEKDGDEAKLVKPKKKTKSRKDKIVPKEDTQGASTTPIAVLALSAPNVEENEKKSSNSSKKKQP